MPPDLRLNDQTTPAEALTLAYACGHACWAAGAKDMDFAVALSEWINVRYSQDRRIRFLRAGFTAGYFNYPQPDISRVQASYALEKSRSAKKSNAGRPPKNATGNPSPQSGREK